MLKGKQCSVNARSPSGRTTATLPRRNETRSVIAVQRPALEGPQAPLDVAKIGRRSKHSLQIALTGVSGPAIDHVAQPGPRRLPVEPAAGVRWGRRRVRG